MNFHHLFCWLEKTLSMNESELTFENEHPGIYLMPGEIKDDREVRCQFGL